MTNLVSFTFSEVQEEIERRRARYAQHPFFSRLSSATSLEDARLIASQIGFFILGFQDVIRLIRSTIRDSALFEFAASNEAGDRGHDKWFLQDLARLDVPCTTEWLFSEAHQVARDTTYSLIADVLRSEHDTSRLALGLTLEAAGAEFFPLMVQFMERLGRASEMKFFGLHHQRVEENHEIFQSDAQERLNRIPVPMSALAEVRGVIERVFASVETLASRIESDLAQASLRRLGDSPIC